MNDEGRIIWGLLICWGLNLLEVFLGFLTLGSDFNNIMLAYVLIGGIGLFQLFYVLPIYFVLRKKTKLAQ